MGRNSVIVSVGLLLASALLVALVPSFRTTTAVCGLSITSLSPVLMCVFPKFPSTFVLAYVPAYFFAALTGQDISLVPIGLQIAAVVVGGLLSLYLAKKREDPLTKATVFWAAVMIGIGLLTAFFSSSQGGAGKFMFFLQHVLGLNLDAATAINFFVRKGLHLTVYATLAISAGMTAFFGDKQIKKLWLAGFCWAIPHAILDEMTQSGSAVRTGSPWDVLLDIAGMSIGLAIVSWRMRAKESV